MTERKKLVIPGHIQRNKNSLPVSQGAEVSFWIRSSSVSVKSVF